MKRDVIRHTSNTLATQLSYTIYVPQTACLGIECIFLQVATRNLCIGKEKKQTK